MLEGKTIAITRSKDDSSEFIDLAIKDNARPISLPTIELVSKGEKIVDEFLDSVKQYDPDYSVFMSSKAVTLLFDTAKKISKFEKLQLAVANTIVMAVGPKTKIALENEGIKVACMPNIYSPLCFFGGILVFGLTAITIVFATASCNFSNLEIFFAVSKRRVTAFELINTE